MAIQSDFYVHDSDRIALQALKAIPGFTQVFKAFMKAWSEKQFRILNMSSNLRINENQLPKYYDMLPPICDKLGIDVPELFLTHDVYPNAYTAGDTEPFIVMTSGLLETLPDELIPSVLAHECGHIACHHCLYTTMGRFVLSEAINYLGLSDLAILPIQVAFSYWMRCSELSADRAAAICDGSADKVIETCMRFAGFDKDIDGVANVDAFMAQAIEYQNMVNDNKWNKTLEFLLFNHEDHPLNAVRAYECNAWAKSERFTKICNYVNASNSSKLLPIQNFINEIPMVESSKSYIGNNLDDALQKLTTLGFTNVKTEKITQKGLMVKEGQVIGIRIGNKDGFEMCEWYSVDAEITVSYYEPETEAEVAAAHPGQLRSPDSSKRYLGKIYSEVADDFINSGFTAVKLEPQIKEKKGWFDKEGSILTISINGQTQFEKGEWFDQNALVRIVYQSFQLPSE